MLGSTHTLTGVVAGLQLAASAGWHLDPVHTLLLAGVAAAGALLPDIDMPASTVGRRFKLLSVPISVLFRHRGITHSLPALILVAFFAIRYQPIYGAALAVGYGSHLVADMVTRNGIMLFWPFPAFIHALPRGLRITTGGLIERLIFLGLSLILFAWIIWPVRFEMMAFLTRLMHCEAHGISVCL